MKKSYLLTIVILSVAAVLCLGATVALALRADALNKRLTADVSSSCLVLSESLADTRTSLAKLSARGESEELRRDIAVSAGMAATALSHLPLGDEVLSRTMSFLNQVADWSKYAADAADAAALYATCDTLCRQLNAYLMSSPAALTERLLRGGEEVSAGTDIFTLPETDYPRLIYDGPFSAAAQSETMTVTEGLPEATEAQIRSAAEALGTVDSLSLVKTDVAYWYVTGVTDTGSYTAAYTALGARLWWVDYQYNTGCDPTLTDEEAQAKALAFAARMGYEGLTPVFLQHTERGVLVNLAAMQDGIICYSDLVKVTLCGDGDRPVLFDAGNYLRLHKLRTVTSPLLTEEQARAYLPASAENYAPGRLALVPDEEHYRGEDVLCYEYVFTDLATGKTCYCYLRADSGEIFDLLLLEGEAVV